MLSSYTLGHSKTQDFLRWNPNFICQWLNDFKNPKATVPHVKLLTLTGANAKEDEILHAEPASIATALSCRLGQPEFKNTSLFPVLVVSLFGPRYGRLLQAEFENFGTLSNPRRSTISSTAMKGWSFSFATTIANPGMIQK